MKLLSDTTLAVMAGLDPAIQAPRDYELAQECGLRQAFGLINLPIAWMAGSSPAMTHGS